MTEGLENKEEVPRPGWVKERSMYRCADGVQIDVPRAICEPLREASDETEPSSGSESDSSEPSQTEPLQKAPPRYWVARRRGPENKGLKVLPCVCGTWFGRDMSAIEKGSESVRTIVFPNTTRWVLDDAFRGCLRLGRVLFADGSRLEKVGSGCFLASGIEEFLAPPSLRQIGPGAFAYCTRLKRVELNEGLERIGVEDDRPDSRRSYCDRMVFQNSAIRELTIPSTVREVGDDAFLCGRRLRVVWVQEGCAADVRAGAGRSVAVFSRQTMVGDRLLWDLRALREVALPDGIQRIGCKWFSGSEIEGVTVPASVKEIEEYAFFDCANLRRALFAEGSQL